jgi:hypothetical protein
MKLQYHIAGTCCPGNKVSAMGSRQQEDRAWDCVVGIAGDLQGKHVETFSTHSLAEHVVATNPVAAAVREELGGGRLV